MGYAVYHVERGKDSGSSLGKHIDRTPGSEKSYRNANPDLTQYNFNVPLLHDWHTKSLNVSIKECISKGYKSPKKIRKDAVTHLKHILTFSHEDTKRIFNDDNYDIQKNWIRTNLEFISKEFGDTNIVRFTLHLDEKTPHIHCVTVPLTKDGRLSAKEIIGGKEEMSERQSRYAEMMKPFGLDRGIEGSTAKHTSVDYFYGHLTKAEREEKMEISFPIIEKPSRMESLSEYKRNTEEMVKQHILSLKQEFDAKLLKNNFIDAKQSLREQRTSLLNVKIAALKNERNKVNEERVKQGLIAEKLSNELVLTQQKVASWRGTVKTMLIDKDEVKRGKAYRTLLNVVDPEKNKNKGLSRE